MWSDDSWSSRACTRVITSRLAAHGDQEVASFDVGFVLEGFVFWNTPAHERSRHAAQGRARQCSFDSPEECCREWTGDHDRAYPG